MPRKVSEIGQHLGEEHRVHLLGRTGQGDTGNAAAIDVDEATETGRCPMGVGDSHKPLGNHRLLLIGAPDAVAEALVEGIEALLVTYQGDTGEAGDDRTGQIIAGRSQATGEDDQVTPPERLGEHRRDRAIVGNDHHALDVVAEAGKLGCQ